MSTDPIDPPVPEPGAAAEVASETLHFDYPGSDIVLRSCDSHNFHVPKLYIINNSPVLRETIRKVSNTFDVAHVGEPEPLPVVELPENRVTLHSLLTIIFPVVPVLPPTSEQIIELLAVAQKYQMESALNDIRGAISRQHPPFFRPETAFHIYFLAQKQGLHQEALQAARVTLRLPMVLEDLGDKLGFFDMKGAYLYELWKYHKCIQTYLKSAVPVFKDTYLPGGVKALRCSSLYGSPDRGSFPQWLDDYIGSIAKAPYLFDLIEFEDAWARHIKEIVASHSQLCFCVAISSQLRRAFWEALTAFIDEAIERARRTGMTVVSLR